MLNEILFFRIHPPQASATTSLRPIGIDRQPLHVTLVGHRNDHVLFDYQVLDIERPYGMGDLRSSFITVLFFDLSQFILEDV